MPEKTDDELGLNLVAEWVASIAQKKGLTPDDPAIAESIENIINATLHMDYTENDNFDINNIAIETALKKAASGKFSVAGKILQEYIKDGCERIIITKEAVTGRGRQKHYASKPRPKKKPTNKSMVIEKMRRWRTKHHSFDEFIEAAINGSVDDLLSMEEIAGDKVKLFWGDIAEEKKSKKTLLDWWTDCIKEI